MGRKLRHLEHADWFHVHNRGADRQDIFSLPGDRELFESLIGETSAATAVEVHAYALMTNHFHFLVFDPDNDLARFMQVLSGRYALAYNGRTSRTGPLFTGRYGSVPITDDAHLLTEARYVERNPLDIVPPAALPAYRHSSLGAYLGRRQGPEWLHTDALLPMMTGSAYLRFVLDDLPCGLDAPNGLPSVQRLSVDDLQRATSEVCNVDFADQSGAVRNIALAIAFELRIASSIAIGELLGISPAGVRMSARRGRVLCDTDTSMSRLRQRIVGALRSSPVPVTRAPDPGVTELPMHPTPE